MLTRLKKRRDFVSVAQGKIFISVANMIVQMQYTQNQFLRVGFTASKRVGSAVKRNRAKRRLRALAELVLKPLSHQSVDIVFIAKPSLVDVPFPKLQHDLFYALKRLNLLPPTHQDISQ